MALTKKQVTDFLGPMRDEQFDKIYTFLDAEGYKNPTLDDFRDWLWEPAKERIVEKLDGMAEDQARLKRVGF